MNLLSAIHSWLRWLILLIAIVGIIKFIVGWLQSSEYKGMDRGLMSGFSGLMDLQSTLGILLLLRNGFSGTGFPLYRLEHGLLMIAAAVVAHMSARWKNADSIIRFRNNLSLIVGSLILVLIGIAVLPGGLSR